MINTTGAQEHVKISIRKIQAFLLWNLTSVTSTSLYLDEIQVSTIILRLCRVRCLINVSICGMCECIIGVTVLQLLHYLSVFARDNMTAAQGDLDCDARGL